MSVTALKAAADFVAHDDAPTVLEARDISLSYANARVANNTVLTDFNLTLRAGEIVAVIGPSGVGKTSLLRVLAGLYQSDGGSVSVHGKTLSGPHPRLSFVFQDACLLPWLKLVANVGFGLDFKHQPKISKTEKKHRINAAIEEVDLAHAKGLYPNQLSGGMMQRVALARALAREPEILLLDEPFSALDEITRGDMQVLLKRVTTHYETAAVLVTHSIDEALLVADRIVLLGGHPATTMQTWTIDVAHPRDEATAALAEYRIDITRHMREARHATGAAQ